MDHQVQTIHSLTYPTKFILDKHLTLISNVQQKNRFVRYSTTVKENMMNFVELHDSYSLEILEMIDIIQRLGIDYLFEQEIREALQQQYILEYPDGHHNGHYHQDQRYNNNNNNKSLHEVALRFRLLRQQGYSIMSDVVFDKFNGKDGKFKQELRNDKEGLLSLFEASHMGLKGEQTLDEAYTFCLQHLQTSSTGDSKSSDLHHTQSGDQQLEDRRIARILKYPHHKSIPRCTANDLLQELLRNPNGWRRDIAELAMLEFEMSHTLYHNEINHILVWWKDLGLVEELKFARDQPLKWYMWSVAAIPDPRFSEERIELFKPISFIYIIDDIFDVYATPEELSLFMEAVRRWEFESLKSLPKYMKICLEALLRTTTEISERIWIKYGWNPHQCLRKGWVDLIQAFLVESNWLTTGQLPTPEVYLTIGKITSGVPLVLMHMLFLLGEKFDDNGSIRDHCYHSIVSSSATILRLWDDLGNAKDEDQNGRDGSYINSYMKESTISLDCAREHVAHMISDEWKQLNNDCLLLSRYPSSTSDTFAKVCHNVARTVPLMYSYDDNESLPPLKKLISSLLFGLTRRMNLLID